MPVREVNPGMNTLAAKLRAVMWTRSLRIPATWQCYNLSAERWQIRTQIFILGGLPCT